MGQGGRGQSSCYPDRPYYPRGLEIGEVQWSGSDFASFCYMAGRSPSSSDASTSGSAGYIEHTVSKLDTLAGVAIKYGVEVADVKRLNGLTTDLQMFALKTLRIPLPGRHPPSAALTSPVRARCESSSSRLGVHRAASSCESSPHNGISHRAMEKRPLTSAMGMLRGYYGLASMSRANGEGTEMATYKSDNEAHSEDEPFSPILQPRDEGRRYSTGDRRDVSFGYARESCDNLLDTCWSLQTPNNLGTDSSLLMRSSRDPFGRVGEIETLSEVETWPKERPIRRRAKGEFGSDELLSVGERVAFPSRSPAPRPRDASTLPSTRLVTSIPLNGWHSSSEGPVAATGMKPLGAALLGSKGTVGGLISKVRRSASATSLNENGKTMSAPAPASPGMSPAPLGTSSVLEGLTTVIRRAKAALD